MFVQYHPDPILIMTPNMEWTPDCRNTSRSNVTFGWSDFPCQGDDLFPSSASFVDEAATSSSSSSSLLSDSIPRTPPPSVPTWKQSIAPPPSPTSCCTILEGAEEEEEILPSKVEMPITERPAERRRVRFAPVTRVRTHTLVLGDHPLCTGGMALQLGWASSGTQYVPLRSHPCPKKRNLNSFRLSYQQRRDRLQRLTGLSGSQLLHEEYLLVCCGGVAAMQQQDACIYDEV
jgi:hypothetical protein